MYPHSMERYTTRDSSLPPERHRQQSTGLDPVQSQPPGSQKTLHKTQHSNLTASHELLHPSVFCEPLLSPPNSSRHNEPRNSLDLTRSHVNFHPSLAQRQLYQMQPPLPPWNPPIPSQIYPPPWIHDPTPSRTHLPPPPQKYSLPTPQTYPAPRPQMHSQTNPDPPSSLSFPQIHQPPLPHHFASPQTRSFSSSQTYLSLPPPTRLQTTETQLLQATEIRPLRATDMETYQTTEIRPYQVSEDAEAHLPSKHSLQNYTLSKKLPMDKSRENRESQLTSLQWQEPVTRETHQLSATPGQVQCPVPPTIWQPPPSIAYHDQAKSFGSVPGLFHGSANDRTTPVRQLLSPLQIMTSPTNAFSHSEAQLTPSLSRPNHQSIAFSSRCKSDTTMSNASPNSDTRNPSSSSQLRPASFPLQLRHNISNPSERYTPSSLKHRPAFVSKQISPRLRSESPSRELYSLPVTRAQTEKLMGDCQRFLAWHNQATKMIAANNNLTVEGVEKLLDRLKRKQLKDDKNSLRYVKTEEVNKDGIVENRVKMAEINELGKENSETAIVTDDSDNRTSKDKNYNNLDGNRDNNDNKYKIEMNERGRTGETQKAEKRKEKGKEPMVGKGKEKYNQATSIDSTDRKNENCDQILPPPAKRQRRA
ncbi:hypothetical protein K435DRAFT_864595 [Dendrothele bispora CBS 962.96]|uniref:Uncharacterized protein n=1 Tax=Dendrothele bispora (strain CBS 962.96) TaxID=1314807 RepID=A0A4S8LLG9_DENBC|nr:hypothetical protein K435DRAFT_864595 [Dendrothele bispora CBS 962.96]